MALPKIKQPLFEITIPSTKQVVHFRPFTVAEEKILMIAKEADEFKSSILAVKQLITNCIQEKIDVERLASFDIEFLFIQLRSKSVSNIVEGVVKDEDGESYPIQINLDKVRMSCDTPERVLHLNDQIAVEMHFPTLEVMEKLAAGASANKAGSAETNLASIRACISSIIEGETVYEAKDYSTQELDDFICSFGIPEMEKTAAFFENLPKVCCDVSYKTKSGEIKKLTLEGTEHFFGF